MNGRTLAETLSITICALLVSLVIFGVFMFAFAHVRPNDLFYWMYIGAFGTKFSWQYSLTRAAPLILAALCTALPARLGLIVIGGEGSLALGGLAAAGTGLLLAGHSPYTIQFGMAGAACVAGGLLILVCGGLRYWRGVNATISSLLLAYIAIYVFDFLVEGPMRDPASLNKPATYPIPPRQCSGPMFGLDVHWGWRTASWPAFWPGFSWITRRLASPRGWPGATCEPRRPPVCPSDA